jgi:ribose/xylose/arabinose/galactoside ABC-type transport system permease subunit
VILSVSLLVSVLAGVWNGLLVVLLDLQPIIATLILMVAGRGIAQLIANGQIVTFDASQSHGFVFLARGSFLWLPFPVTIVAIVAIVTGILSRGTALGLFVESVGNNPTASRFAGVPGRLVKVLAYTVCGAFAGVAGWVATADIQGADANNVGINLELDAILAVCLGGTALTGGRFSLVGSLVGALFIQTLTSTILTRGVPAEMTMVVKGLIVIGVCMLQSPVFRSKFQRLFKGGAK